jgi:hypothetical protein
MALDLGRPVASHEIVHHRNDNLELWSTAHPKGQRVADLVVFGLEMLARYAPEIGAWALTRTSASQAGGSSGGGMI